MSEIKKVTPKEIEELQGLVGFEIPEFKTYPAGNPYEGTYYGVREVREDQKRFTLAGEIYWHGRRTRKYVDYGLLQDAKTLARRERRTLKPKYTYPVAISFRDDPVRVVYNVNEGSVRRRQGVIKSMTARNFSARIDWMVHPEEPPLYQRGRSLRNDIATLITTDPEKTLHLYYPAYTPLPDYLNWLEQGKDQSARDSFKVTRDRQEAELDFMVADESLPNGYGEIRRLLVPGSVYEFPASGYLRVLYERFQDRAVLDRIETTDGLLIRMVVPNPENINFTQLLKQANGSFRVWSSIYENYPFRLEMVPLTLTPSEQRLIQASSLT